MNQRKSMPTEINLRTLGLGLAVEGARLIAVAVHNKYNKLSYQGFEVLEDFESLQDEEVIEFIEDFQAKYKVKRSDAMMILPRSMFDIQFADFPAEAGASLDEAIEYQLPNYFPGENEETDFFHQVIHRGDQLRVMIIAARKEYMGHAFGFMRRYKLKLSGIGLSTLALVNGLAKSDAERFEQERIVVFDFHPGHMELIAINQGVLTTTTIVPIPDQETFDQDVFLQDLEDAFSRARMEPNDVNSYLWSGKPPEILEQVLYAELLFPKDTWQDPQGAEVPSQAYSGFGAAVTTLKDRVPYLFNFLPEKLRKRHKRLPVMLAAIIVPILFLTFIALETREYLDLRSETIALEEQVEKVKGRSFALSDARTAYEIKEQELDIFKRYQTNQMLVKMLLNMANDLPTHTYLTSMTIKNGNELSLQGESENPFEVQRILQNSPFLKDVDASRAITNSRAQDGKKRFSYNATIVLEALR
jgi:Tfp pilus assembly protein PilN